MNAPPTFASPLVVHRRKSEAVIAVMLTLALGLLFAWLSIFPPSPAMPVWMRIIVALAALGAFSATYVSGKQWVEPPILLEATHQGIVAFQKRSVSDKGPSGVLLPWSAIEKIETQVLSVPTGDGDSRLRCLVLHLREGHGLPVKRISLGMSDTLSIHLGRVAPDAHDNTLYLDGDSDYGSYEALASELNRRRQNSTR